VSSQAPPASPSRDVPAGYFADLRERFEQAAALTGERRHELDLAGLRLRLAFAGAAMEEALLPPFAHLAASDPAAPGLTIRVFDSASTGVEPPSPAWASIEAAPGTNPTARLRSAGACVLAAAGTGSVTAVLPGRGEAVFHLPDAARIPPIERAVPLREALQLLAAPRERWLTHAGAVGCGGRGVLIVGRGGSGKSTLALACALAGMEIAADDYVLLEGGPTPSAHALQSTAKLTADSAARLGLEPAAIDAAGFEPTLEGPAKALVDISALAPGRMKRRLGIAAIVAPRLSRERSSLVRPGLTNSEGELEGPPAPCLRPISAAAGLRALAPSTLIQSGFRSAEWLAALGELARAVPSYGLDLSPDPAANAAAVKGLVAELG
jgi:hypothetical protein